ncbi:uncharacterized protein [Henckelia pumila]|uniref:uncharacterized protein n=1 Tax=Henckelia pumila TaxID=405737 RepID=UPI003C6DDF6A
MAEDRASGGFLGSGITVEAAREAVWSLRQEDNGNGGSAGDVLQSEKSFTATNTGHCLEARLSPPRSASAPRFGLFGMRSGQEGSNSSTLRRNSSASASLNSLASTSTTATSAPLGAQTAGALMRNYLYRNFTRFTRSPLVQLVIFHGRFIGW